MSARRCSICAVNWPVARKFYRCPICKDRTSHFTNADPITYGEANKVVNEALFEQYYAVHSNKRQREIAKLQAIWELPCYGEEESDGTQAAND